MYSEGGGMAIHDMHAQDDESRWQRGAEHPVSGTYM